MAIQVQERRGYEGNEREAVVHWTWGDGEDWNDVCDLEVAEMNARDGYRFADDAEFVDGLWRMLTKWIAPDGTVLDDEPDDCIYCGKLCHTCDSEGEPCHQGCEIDHTAFVADMERAMREDR